VSLPTADWQKMIRLSQQQVADANFNHSRLKERLEEYNEYELEDVDDTGVYT
jgi:hypothetical protein